MDTVNQFLSLALFIMLLSFFIILNAISSFEDTKSKPVLNSISVTFSGAEIKDSLEANVVPAPEESTNEGETLDKLDKIKAAFNAHITGVKIRKNRLGTIMHTRMPLDEFERALTLPAGIDGSFLPTLSSLLQTRETEVTYRMDIILNLKESPADAVNAGSETLRNNMRKIAKLAEIIEQSGVPKKLVSAGLDKGEPDTVDIYFRRYEPFDPTGVKE